jgi:hypothetical protein
MSEPIYPNVWGPGQLFAFSGIDGETDWFHPFVASTLGDEAGFLFRLRVPRKLWCEPRVSAVKSLVPRVVAGDCVDFLVESSRGESFPLRYLFFDCCTVIGETSVHMPPVARAEGSAAVSTGADAITHSSREEHTALVTQKFGEKCLFAFSFSHESAARAIEQGRRVLGESLPGLLQRKLFFYSALPELPGAGERRRRTVAKAFSVLKANVESAQGLIPCHWTTPDRWPHADCWLWDSCFHSFGYRVFSVELAAEALDAVLASQRADGFIAHRIFPAGTSALTQPPLLAWAYFELFQYTGRRALIENTYSRLGRFVEWVLANRRVGDGALLGWKLEDDPLCRCGESGMDNSPRFDSGEPLEAVDLNAYVVSELKCLTEMALTLKRYGDAASWKEQARKLSDAMNARLWDEEDGFYYDRAADGRKVRLKTSAGFLPLFAMVASLPQAERLLAHLTEPTEFWTAFPVPSVARSEPACELDMWRGPTWLNIDLLIIEGLERYKFHDVAHELATRALAGVEHWYVRLGSLFEYYDPDGETPPTQLDRKQRLRTGSGYEVICDYNWTAACYLCLASKTER